jgi:hypothetical protein
MKVNLTNFDASDSLVGCKTNDVTQTANRNLGELQRKVAPIRVVIDSR